MIETKSEPAVLYNYRYDWLTEIIYQEGFQDIAEIGLNRCETLNCLMEKCPAIKSYVGVDRLTNSFIEDSVKKYAGKRNYGVNKSGVLFSQGRFRFIQGDSTEVGNMLDQHFDLVFIDADHEYEKVLLDIKAWEDKVRPGGIFCGDDYGNIHWPGVKKAVDEYFGSRPNVVINVIGSPANVWWVRK